VLDLGPVSAAADQDTVPWRVVLGRSPERVVVELG